MLDDGNHSRLSFYVICEMISLPLPLHLPPALHLLGVLSAPPLPLRCSVFLRWWGLFLSAVLPVWLRGAAADDIHVAFELIFTFCRWNPFISPLPFPVLVILVSRCPFRACSLDLWRCWWLQT